MLLNCTSKSHDIKMADTLPNSTEKNKEENDSFPSSHRLFSDADAYIEKAKECLLLRQFKLCHKMCMSGVNLAKTQAEEERLEHKSHNYSINLYYYVIKLLKL